jgi:hypothetical protein
LPHLADIDAAIARLRAQDATQIVVGGLIMGGNSSANEFALVPANPLNKYVSVDAEHLDTPTSGRVRSLTGCTR